MYIPTLSREPNRKQSEKNSFTENVLNPSGPDDNLGPRRRNPDFDALIAVLRELSRQHLIQLRISHKLQKPKPKKQKLSTEILSNKNK